MLTVFGRQSRFCDGLSRRSFLQIGGLSFAGSTLTLADIFRAEARGQSTTGRHKSVINIFLAGGAPHQDMFDLKPDAPKEIRGEFNPIATNVTGLQIGETFQQMATRMDKCVVIRSVVGATGGHDAYQCMTGWNPRDMAAMGGRPSIGSVVSRLQGPVDPSVPPFVGLTAPTQHRPWSDAGSVGYLGSSYAPFKPDGDGMANMVLNGVNREQMGDRRKLLSSFDNLRRDLDASGSMKAMDALSERALNVLTSSRLLEALDISKEDVKTRDRYGDGKPYQFQYDGAPTVNDQLLMARRLIEAGVRVVSLSYGRWDAHSKNFDLVRDHGKKLDQCLSALIDDLEMRGLLADTTIAVWGEFGRTPKINGNAGRDHWPQVSCALLIGGGLRTGQVIGATNRLGEYATARPVTFAEVMATLYHQIGIDPSTTTINDPTGRPQYPVDAPVMRELV